SGELDALTSPQSRLEIGEEHPAVLRGALAHEPRGHASCSNPSASLRISTGVEQGTGVARSPVHLVRTPIGTTRWPHMMQEPCAAADSRDTYRSSAAGTWQPNGPWDRSWLTAAPPSVAARGAPSTEVIAPNAPRTNVSP